MVVVVAGIKGTRINTVMGLCFPEDVLVFNLEPKNDLQSENHGNFSFYIGNHILITKGAKKPFRFFCALLI